MARRVSIGETPPLLSNVLPLVVITIALAALAGSTFVSAHVAASPSVSVVASPIFDGWAHGRRNGTGSLTTTSPLTTYAVNDVLIAMIASDGPGGQRQSITSVSGGGLNWQRVVNASAQPGDSEVWTATTSQPLSGATITAARQVDGFDGQISVVALSGSSGIGHSASASSPGGPPAVTVSSTAVGSMMLAVGNDWDMATPRNVAAGQALLSQFVDYRVGDTYWSQRLLALTSAAGQQVSLSDVAPTDHRFNMVGVEVLGAGAPPTPTPSATPTGTPTPTATPTPAPPPTGKPGPTNTGVPAGHNLLVLNRSVRAMTLPAANTNPAGCANWSPASGLSTNRDGCTIHDVDASTDFTITNNNTVLQFDKIHDPNTRYPAVDNQIIITCDWSSSAYRGILIEDTEVYANSGISYGIAGGFFTLLRVNIHNANHDVQGGGNGHIDVEDSWLHGIVSQTGDHTELVYLDSSPNVTFRGNDFQFNPANGAVADVFSDGIHGPGGPMVLDGNYWDGTGTQWIFHGNDPGKKLTFTNNKVDPNSYSLALAGFYGGKPSVTGANAWEASGNTPDYGHVIAGDEIPGL